MLGWHITVYRQTNGGASPATAESPEGTRLAVWQTGLGGLTWLDELVKAGKAIDLGGQGYPCRYTATAENIIPRVIDMPRGVGEVWLCDAFDIKTDKAVVAGAPVADCRPDEWLLVEAWDES